MVNNLDTLILTLKEDSMDLYHIQNSEEFSFDNGAEDAFLEKLSAFEQNVEKIEFSLSQQVKLRRLLKRINAHCAFNQGILVNIYF